MDNRPWLILFGCLTGEDFPDESYLGTTVHLSTLVPHAIVFSISFTPLEVQDQLTGQGGDQVTTEAIDDDSDESASLTIFP